MSQAQAAQNAQPNKVMIEDGGDPTQGIDQAKKAVPSILATTSNPTGSKSGNFNYSQYAGPIGDLFDKLQIKENAYSRSDEAIKSYQEMIKGQRSKVKVLRITKSIYRIHWR